MPAATAAEGSEAPVAEQATSDGSTSNEAAKPTEAAKAENRQRRRRIDSGEGRGDRCGASRPGRGHCLMPTPAAPPRRHLLIPAQVAPAAAPASPWATIATPLPGENYWSDRSAGAPATSTAWIWSMGLSATASGLPTSLRARHADPSDVLAYVRAPVLHSIPWCSCRAISNDCAASTCGLGCTCSAGCSGAIENGIWDDRAKWPGQIRI